jgi:uncharacterized membrane protein required for colicin V production
MNALFDIIIIVILVFCAAFGYKNGFVRTIMNFLSFVIAFFTARAFAPQFADYLYSAHIRPRFANAAQSQIERFLTNNIDLNSLANNASPPDNFVSMLRGYGFELPDIQGWLNADMAKENIAANLAGPVARQFSYFLAFIIILAAVLILLKVAVNILDSLVKLPGLNSLNKTGGIILGLIYGLGVCYICVFLASNFMPYLEANGVIDSWAQIRNGTVFFRLLYENSPLDKIIGWF